MKAYIEGNRLSSNILRTLARAFIVAAFAICVLNARAQLDPGGGKYGPTNAPLDSWMLRVLLHDSDAEGGLA